MDLYRNYRRNPSLPVTFKKQGYKNLLENNSKDLFELYKERFTFGIVFFVIFNLRFLVKMRYNPESLRTQCIKFIQQLYDCSKLEDDRILIESVVCVLPESVRIKFDFNTCFSCYTRICDLKEFYEVRRCPGGMYLTFNPGFYFEKKGCYLEEILKDRGNYFTLCIYTVLLGDLSMYSRKILCAQCIKVMSDENVMVFKHVLLEDGTYTTNQMFQIKQGEGWVGKYT